MNKPLEISHLLRIRGEDSTALEVLADALVDESIPIYGEIPSGDLHASDPVQIDLNLQVVVDPEMDLATLQLPSGVSYAGLTPAQRGAFHVWLQDPTRQAPAAFQRLLVAHIEVGLLDEHASKGLLYRELSQWALADAWKANEWHARALLLALWLTGNSEGIHEWTSQVALPPAILERALAMQMLLERPLSAAQFGRLASAWGIPNADKGTDVLALRLDVVADALEKPPLEAVREQLSEAELAPKPWRTAHRSLRFGIPQPMLRPYLEEAFRDALDIAEPSAPEQQVMQVVDPVAQEEADWRLVVEFGQSRSEYYEHVMNLAQRMSGYQKIMDEDRRIVHRISVRKREMRRFWRIWDYIQGWSTTHVYLNGEELEHWKIWPYSQYLR